MLLGRFWFLFLYDINRFTRCPIIFSLSLSSHHWPIPVMSQSHAICLAMLLFQHYVTQKHKTIFINPLKHFNSINFLHVSNSRFRWKFQLGYLFMIENEMYSNDLNWPFSFCGEKHFISLFIFGVIQICNQNKRHWFVFQHNS